METAVNLSAALEHAHAGLPVFPARITRRFKTWEKAPCIKNWRAEASTDEVQIRVWWREFPHAVPGIELGRAALVVIDPDRHGKGPDGIEAFAQLCADIGGLPRHPTTNTPQGHHHIFRQNGGEPIGNSTGSLPPGIDVRGTGGWIVAPGSVRLDGVRYTPREGTPPLTDAYRAGTIPPLPGKIDALIREPSHRPHGPRAGSEFIAASGDPVDVEAELIAMEYESRAGNGVNVTLCRVIPSLLQKGEHPGDVLERIVAAVTEMAERCGLKWSVTLETKSTVRRILSAYHNLLLKDHDPATGGVPGWLPGEFHEAWLARTAAGARPTFGFNRGGFYIRKAQGGEASERLQEPERLQERPASEPAAEPKKYRFPLLRFGQMRPGTEPDYLVDELIPIAGLVVVYGAPKSGKSFWVLDLSLHIALAWEYRDRSVQQGAVVYCAFEGAHGYRKRCEAFRRHHCLTDEDDPPLYVVPGRADLIKDHGALIHDLREQLATAPAVPVKCVILDTLNKSLIGSESKDVDMANYIAAAEHIQTEFNCVVIIVHHHGIDETRPRGHTSLRAAVSAQIKITRDEQNNITAEIEDMRDGPEGAQIVSRLVVVDVGTDRADKPLTSAAVEPVDPGAQRADGKRLPKLTKNQRTMFAILQAAPNGLFANEWSEQAREAGLGLKRRADLTDLRSSLQARKLVVHSSDKWFVAAEYRNCPS